ncbi:argininosuccinate lyase [bacterium MnTg02]|nr:argininosuccinate lyase [bacterium MnTg02]
MLETLSAATISATHLSRLAEEIIIWSSSAFGFVALSDNYSTGSSIMPQKRNPDAAELVRAKVGRIAAAFHSLVIVMKGLPLAYSKDMQEDKELTFDALDNYSLAIAAMSGMITDLELDTQALKKSAGQAYSTATDLADWLVRVLELPFRKAHHVTGEIVAAAETARVPLHRLPIAAMQAIEPRITDDIFSVLTVTNSVRSRTSYGGTAPKNVRKFSKSWIKRLEKDAGSR